MSGDQLVAAAVSQVAAAVSQVKKSTPSQRYIAGLTVFILLQSLVVFLMVVSSKGDHYFLYNHIHGGGSATSTSSNNGSYGNYKYGMCFKCMGSGKLGDRQNCPECCGRGGF